MKRLQVIVLALVALPAVSPATEAALPDLSSPDRWKAFGTERVAVTVKADQGKVRMDFDFGGTAGYALARKDVPLDLPKNWHLSFRLHGTGRRNDLELKLVDRSGENVWWYRRKAFAPTEEGTSFVIQKRQVEFAWGPAGGGEPRDIAALELTLVAREGGSGTIWLEGLAIAEDAVVRPAAGPPIAIVSSSASGAGPERLWAQPPSAWHSDPSARGPVMLTLDLRERREWGGLVLDWTADFARRFAVEVSDDGARWTSVRTVVEGDGGSSWLQIPDSESRFVRLVLFESGTGRGFGLSRVSVEPVSFGASLNGLFTRIAAASPRGHWPRYLLQEQAPWTLIGTDGGAEKGLLSADGALEPAAASFSVEPFVFADGALVTWADVASEASLEEGSLPLPSVTWRKGGLSMKVTALAEGVHGDERVWARWRVTNGSSWPMKVRLYLAVRPLQVSPPWQLLGVDGGVTPIRSLEWNGSAVVVDGDRSLLPLTAPDGFGAISFDQGSLAQRLERGELPANAKKTDPVGLASGALAFTLDLPPGQARDVVAVLPIARGGRFRPTAGDPGALFEARLAAAAAEWREKLGRVTIAGPARLRPMLDTLTTSLAWVLIQRDGAALQPGSRSYRRSWIRDGALSSAALLRLGHPEAAKAFAEWYAPFQFPSGAVPCCIDGRGADPTPEHDSHGELVWLVAEVFRYTGDTAFASRLYPAVAKAASHIDLLRQRRRTAEWQGKDEGLFFGLLPPSISHEGYSAKPMHSYWDDAFGLLGLSDASFLAETLGRTEDARRFAEQRDQFRADFLRSIEMARRRHGISFIPGCADLGDFDPTSTSILLSPGGLEADLPREALDGTFARYGRELAARWDGSKAWESYTPYEWRNVGVFVRLGWRDLAAAAAEHLLADRRPPGWNQWPEVVWRDASTPRFVGDLPHGWVASDFLRAVLDMFAFERPADRALVVGAGVPESWLKGAPEGVEVRGLRTPYGPLSYRLYERDGALTLSIREGTRIPPGGVVFSFPPFAAGASVTVDGAAARAAGNEVVIRRLPAEVVVRNAAARKEKER